MPCPVICDSRTAARDRRRERLAAPLFEPGVHRRQATEARLEAALEAGDSLDARFVLLVLHAGVIQAQVVERYRLEAG